MIRRNGSGRLGREGRDDREEDINPMSGMANLADAMLVLAVGIMIAVLIGWKLDLKKMDSGTEIRTLERDEIESVDINSSALDQNYLEELGTLYYDKSSGNYYILR